MGIAQYTANSAVKNHRNSVSTKVIGPGSN
jgi:hypothetical protein